MPTFDWIQETAWDRYYETGIEKDIFDPITYACRQCSKVFKTVEERDKHESEHPNKNPQIFIRDKELIGDEYTITKKLSGDDIKYRYIDKIKINGRLSSTKELSNILETGVNNYFEIIYSNKDTPKKKINIRVLIANINEIKKIDEIFYKYFSFEDFSSNEIDKFRVETQNYNSCKEYSNGIVAYLHGIMAKDKRTERIGFEDFHIKFNQANESLKKYDTNLSMILRSIVGFNSNFFKEKRTGIIKLDQAVLFFNNRTLSTYCSNKTAVDSIRIPVDLSTAFIVDELVSNFDQMDFLDIESRVNGFNIKYLSQQDHSKMRFVVYRKAYIEGNVVKIDEYRKKLKNDAIFSKYI